MAQLLIVYQANVATTTPGGVIRFTSTYTNTGQVPYSGIAIVTGASNLLANATGDGDRTATSGTLTVTGASVSWTGAIAGRRTVTVTGTVTVHSSVPVSTVLTSTTSTSAPGSNCPSGSTDPRCTVSVTVLTPGLTITKTASATAVVPGQPVGYTITVADTGQTPYAGATVTDSLSGVLGDAAYDGDAAASTGAVSYASPVLTWTGNLAVGATATITYSVTVNNPDTGGKVMTNTVVSAAVGSTCPAGGGNAACTATVTVLTPVLTIVKTANVAIGDPGRHGGLHHHGDRLRADPLHRRHGHRPADRRAGRRGLQRRRGRDGRHRVLCQPEPDLDREPGRRRHRDDHLLRHGEQPRYRRRHPGQYGHLGHAGSNCGSGSTDTDCTATVAVAQLLIVSQADVSSTTPGGVIRFTSTFTNTGQVFYDGITIVPNLSASFAYITADGDQSATSGTLTLTGAGVSWSGDIPAGGTVTVTGTVTVDNPVPANTVLTIIDSTSATGSNCPSGSNDPRCTVSVTVLTPGLTITKTASATAVVPGQPVGYTITVTDSGQTAVCRGDGDGLAVRGAGRCGLRRRRGGEHRRGVVCQPGADLDREPGGGCHRDDHLFRHGEQSRYRREGDDEHGGVGRGRQYLPGRRRERRLHRHRHRADPRPDHRQDRERRHRHARRDGGLHHHGDRLRADPLHRRHIHR